LGIEGNDTNNTNNENNNGVEQMTMEDLLETSMRRIREGQVVEGTIVSIGDENAMVDVGFKSEGMIPIHELRDPESGEIEAEVGQTVQVFVVRIDGKTGEIQLSKERAKRLRVWKDIEDAFKAEEPVEGKVLDRVKGGLTVDIGVRAFLPGSLVDLRPNRRLEEYIGQHITARVINFDRRRSNVVISRKAILEEQRQDLKEDLFERIEEGKLMTGTVKNITDYGVFIDLGGLDGLLHITDISWGRVGHPNEYFNVGDEVEVVVLRFDRERERVSLGYKQRFEDPWTFVPEKYPIGKRIAGKVVSIVDYGAFVELEEGVEGLIHVSEMSWTRKVKNPRSMLEEGEEVEVVVSEVDSERRRLSLSLRATQPNPWEKVAEEYQIGARIQGIVRNLTEFGAFVEIIPGVDGLVHISDMSWTRRVQHPSEIVQKGDEVEAIITAIDVVNQRISLSMKELMPNEWEEYANAHRVGDEVDGKITNITDFGVFIELEPGVEGLCHVSEIDRDPSMTLAEIFEPGQAVRCRILRIDWSENRIGLSMQGVSQEDVGQEPVLQAPEQADSGAGTAMAAALKASGVVEAEAVETTEEAGEATAEAEEEPVEETTAEGSETGESDEVEAVEEAQDEPAEEQQAEATEAGDAAAETDEAAAEEPSEDETEETQPDEAEETSEESAEDEAEKSDETT